MKVISPRMHGYLDFSDNETTRNFYTVEGAVIILVGALTDYQNK